VDAAKAVGLDDTQTDHEDGNASSRSISPTATHSPRPDRYVVFKMANRDRQSDGPDRAMPAVRQPH
jgi:hypothetical protein